MKKWVHSTHSTIENIDSSSELYADRKLERTLESGHSYEENVVFNNVEEMMEWWEEDKLYED